MFEACFVDLLIIISLKCIICIQMTTYYSNRQEKWRELTNLIQGKGRKNMVFSRGWEPETAEK